MAKPVSQIKDLMFRVKNCSVYQVQRQFSQFCSIDTACVSFSGAPLIGQSPGAGVVPYTAGAIIIVDSWAELKAGK